MFGSPAADPKPKVKSDVHAGAKNGLESPQPGALGCKADFYKPSCILLCAAQQRGLPTMVHRCTMYTQIVSCC